VKREQVIDLDPESTVEDLAQKLEEQIKAKHGWAPNLLRSSFTVLVNGKPSETLQDRILKDGDIVAFLSPIGGG
jgi:molybdopterin converting factor small subunit